jgi:murein DD-endopeptidase MepM/ murein hydrolase activator NlpD
MYGHLSRFAPGIRKGKAVRQKQIIGYVGATGVATGPHLDFRLSKNGVFRNPLRETSPRAASLKPAELPNFAKAVSPLRQWADEPGAERFRKIQTISSNDLKN